MKIFFYPLILIVLCVTAFNACTYRDKETLYPTNVTSCDTASVTYTSYVKGFIAGTCAVSGCHDASTASATVNLTTYAGLKTIADNGRLMGSLTHDINYSPMPKNQSKLDDCTIAKLQAWVNAGALNN